MSELANESAMSDELEDLKRKIAGISDSLGRITSAQSAPLFKDFALAYLKEKLSNPTLRDSTKRAFRIQLERHLVPAFGNLPLSRIKNGEWVAWVADIRARQTLTSFFNARKALKEILRKAVDDGHIEKTPNLDNPDESHDVGRVLEGKEIIAILWRSRRPFRFIFYCFWKMGCRPSEILQWEWSMFEWGDRVWINIPARISKTGRVRRLPINSDIGRMLYKKFMAQQYRCIFVFQLKKLNRPQRTYLSAWKRACELANVKNATPYDFRRTFITRCAAEGKPLIYVAKTLDTSIQMIENTYAKAQTEVMEGIVK